MDIEINTILFSKTFNSLPKLQSDNLLSEVHSIFNQALNLNSGLKYQVLKFGSNNKLGILQ